MYQVGQSEDGDRATSFRQARREKASTLFRPLVATMGMFVLYALLCGDRARGAVVRSSVQHLLSFLQGEALRSKENVLLGVIGLKFDELRRSG